MSSVTVVHAAAGCGKTTDLARRYLRFLREGVPARKAIAITFTRKAAAELQERVSLALRTCLGGDAAARAKARLGPAWELYAADAPSDPQVARDALASLSEAPIGTTDAFVQQLLTEFALDAALPVPNPEGRSVDVPLDLPIVPNAGAQRALERAARRILDPPGGGVDPDVALLVRYLPLDDLLVQLARRTDFDHLPLATSSDVLHAAARWMAEVLLRFDVADAWEVADPRDEEAWRRALERSTNREGLWAVPRVAAWLSASPQASGAPMALCGWLRGLNVRSKKRKAIRDALAAELRSFGPATLSLWQVIEALRYPYDDPQQVALADDLRAARWRLRRRVLAEGLTQAALGGELGYSELIEAAIALVQRPPERLLNRFGALLVDEVQDADPRQIRLYQALARLPGVRTAAGLQPMRSYFVGDARQSIYLFRGAEPDGLHLLEEGATEVLQLATNRRSAPRLVNAHRVLFGALEPAMRDQQWQPVASLDALQSDPANERLATPDAPVWVVVPDRDGRLFDDDYDDRALAAFLRRVQQLRAEPGHEHDTAAVLAPNWSIASRACQRIREWTGRADAAFVENNAGRTDGRVSEDVQLWLRAALDRGDDAAWLGVWKHPGVGLSDAALARLARGVGARGPAPGWARRPGFFAELEGLEEPHAPEDVYAFARARGAIRDWLAAVGRTSTSAALEQLVTALEWRTLLAAGPGGPDDVAELEVLLDWVRSLDTDGQPADAILARFTEDHDRPHVHLRRPPGHIACTTIFQCKGLAWDHVCVLRPGRHSRKDPTRDQEDGWMDVDGRQIRLEGLRFDPSGGLLDFRDPLGRLAARIHAVRFTEEAARLAYVAVTRARRSVTLAPVPPRSNPYRKEEPTLSDLVARTWRQELPDVEIVSEPAPAESPSPAAGYAVVTGAPRNAITVPQAGWEERAPSSLGARIDAEVRGRHADAVSSRVRLANGLHLGGQALAPPGTDPQTGRPIASHPLGHLAPYDWGNIVHGWFARWQFRGQPTREEVGAYLTVEWGAAPEDVITWLLAIGEQLARVGGPLWGWVTDPQSKLHFEHPLLALAAARDQGGAFATKDMLLSGRIDLWIEHPRHRVSIVDFKAGAVVPTGWDDLVNRASLKTYSFQLHAYADALRRMGRQVDNVALWFVRTGTSVRWSP